MNIADLSTKGNQPYFMEDTIHLGWRGWLAADEYIQPFLDSKGKRNHLMKSTIISYPKLAASTKRYSGE